MELRILVIALLGVLLFSSCEKYIELDLEQGDPKVVIEANMSDLNPVTAIVSRSSEFFQGEFDPIEDALLVLSDDLGNKDTLLYTQSGIYVGSRIGQVGGTYTLNVIADGQLFTASSYLNASVPIDSIKYEAEESEFPGQEGKYVKFWYKDIPGQRDYYRIQYYYDDVIEIGPNSIRISTDVFDDGLVNEVTTRDSVGVGVKVEARLFKITEQTFDYLNTLQDIVSQQPGGSGVPQNPIQVWSNGALGYFSAAGESSMEIVTQ